ncbi:hypothetical protein [Runella sp. SP2]|uniref:hypothetical protein n=1 Tax=Runella sp. SP2 TaxID=2268026 RepID=UPI000F07EEC0|nr:hypothetical protein [Runella sp. SP2]AYQ31401.1 hypothetical protein DTQ70_04050 [Runella sp. SP2]
MIKYKDRNGEVITGTSLQLLLEALRDGSRFGAEQTLEEYLKETAERVREYNGLEWEVRTDSYENFVADLEKAGYWQRI